MFEAQLLRLLKHTTFVCYADDPPPTPPPPPADGEEDKVTLSKAEFEKIQADNQKMKADHQRTLDEFKAQSVKIQMSTQERTELDKRLEQTQNDLLTTQERAERERIANERNYKTEVEKLTKEKDHWSEKFKNTQIDQSLTNAAVVNKAYRPKQLVALLRDKTELVEVLDTTGKGTGDYVTKVAFETLDDKKLPVTLKLDPIEAIQRMSEMEEHMNLFLAGGSGGVGKAGNPTKDDGSVDIAKLASTDPAEYAKQRKAGTLKLPS